MALGAGRRAEAAAEAEAALPRRLFAGEETAEKKGELVKIVRGILPLEALNLEFDQLKNLPYKTISGLSLAAANPKLKVEFTGNVIAVTYLAGTNPILDVRVGRESRDAMRFRSEGHRVHEFDTLYFSWGAIVNGVADILLLYAPR